jgi:hypothetical protein
MGTENLNNRSTAMTPELLAQFNSSMIAAVREVAVQFLDAVREHPEEMLAAREQYFGTL